MSITCEGVFGQIMADEDILKAGKTEQLNPNDFDDWVGVVKPKIPQCAIDVLKKSKEQGHTLLRAMNLNYKVEEFYKNKEFRNWIGLPANQESFALAWIVGYEETEETRYLVKMKNLNAVFCCLAYHIHDKYWSLASNGTDEVAVLHTRKELEEAGFGEVFTSSLFEVEEVKVQLLKE